MSYGSYRPALPLLSQMPTQKRQRKKSGEANLLCVVKSDEPTRSDQIASVISRAVDVMPPSVLTSFVLGRRAVAGNWGRLYRARCCHLGFAG